MDDARTILADARDRVLSGWMQHGLAADKHGVGVRVTDDRAVRFCARGAILRAAHDHGLTGTPTETAALRAARATAARWLCRDDGDVRAHLSDWNDVTGRTAVDVALMLDAAAREVSP